MTKTANTIDAKIAADRKAAAKRADKAQAICNRTQEIFDAAKARGEVQCSCGGRFSGIHAQDCETSMAWEDAMEDAAQEIHDNTTAPDALPVAKTDDDAPDDAPPSGTIDDPFGFAGDLIVLTADNETRRAKSNAHPGAHYIVRIHENLSRTHFIVGGVGPDDQGGGICFIDARDVVAVYRRDSRDDWTARRLTPNVGTLAQMQDRAVVGEYGRL